MTDFLARMNANDSRAALQELKQRISRVNRDLQTAVANARGFQDPDLSPQGLANRREQLMEQARSKAAAELKQLGGERQRHEARVRAWAEPKRPKVADDPVQLQKLSMAWDRARAMLDAGRSIPQVLATATDPLVPLAIREWAPDYLRASTPAPSGMDGLREEPDYSGLVRSADDRLAELHGGDVKTATGMLRELEVTNAGWQAQQRAIDTQVAGGPFDGLYAAIETHYAEQSAGAGYQDADSGHGDPGHGDAA